MGLAKNTWSTAHSFLLPQNEAKFNEIHKSFGPFPTKYENVSEKIRGRLFATDTNWRFFTSFETDEMFAENVTEKNRFGDTPLHKAVFWADSEIAKAVIEAGVDIDAKDEFGMTALHLAVRRNDLEIGKLLTDSGARLNIRSGCVETPKFETALRHAVHFDHREFAEMLRKKMANI